MLYVVTTGAGALLGWASTPDALPPTPPDGAVVALAEWTEPPALPLQWIPALRNWAVPAAVPRRLSRLEFASRLSLQEQVAVELAEAEHPDAQTRATLRVVRRSLDRATDVRVTDPRTQMGVAAVVDVLVGAGIVPAAQRDARIAALLAP